LPEPVPPYQAVYVDELSKGDRILYVFAKMKYQDIFRVPHWTHVCVVVNQDLTGNKPCDIYNDTDPDKGQKPLNPN
jgi:hypothetical protein